jgi:hypothetical protein
LAFAALFGFKANDIDFEFQAKMKERQEKDLLAGVVKSFQTTNRKFTVDGEEMPFSKIEEKVTLRAEEIKLEKKAKEEEEKKLQRAIKKLRRKR